MDALTVARIEEAAHAASSREIAADSLDIGAGVATFLEPGSWVNQAWNMGLHGPVSNEDIDELVEFFEHHNVEPRLPVCTLADPTLLSGLARRRFVTDAFINVFVLEPTNTTDVRTTGRHATGLTLELVDPADDVQAEVFAVSTSQGFHDGNPPPDAMVRTVRQVLLGPGNTAVLARVDGVPAGGGIVGISQANDNAPIGAGLFGTSVLSEFRARGVQQALIAERLRLAHEGGAALVTIASNPGVATERNAARFGFSLSYVKAVMSRPMERDEPSD
jgi:hypothetical protein